MLDGPLQPGQTPALLHPSAPSLAQPRPAHPYPTSVSRPGKRRRRPQHAKSAQSRVSVGGLCKQRSSRSSWCLPTPTLPPTPSTLLSPPGGRTSTEGITCPPPLASRGSGQWEDSVGWQPAGPFDPAPTLAHSPVIKPSLGAL